MKIKFEGKIKFKEFVNAKTLAGILSFLIEEQSFVPKKFSKDEIKLEKIFIGTNGEQPDTEVEIEIETGEDKFEIEIESSNLEVIKDLTENLAARLSSLTKAKKALAKDLRPSK